MDFFLIIWGYFDLNVPVKNTLYCSYCGSTCDIRTRHCEKMPLNLQENNRSNPSTNIYSSSIPINLLGNRHSNLNWRYCQGLCKHDYKFSFSQSPPSLNLPQPRSMSRVEFILKDLGKLFAKDLKFKMVNRPVCNSTMRWFHHIQVNSENARTFVNYVEGGDAARYIV